MDFEEIDRNIKKRAYPVIGSGSGRIVFDLMNGYVVKVAKNNRGLEQNKEEHHIAGMDHYHIVANIAAHSEDNRYLVMEKAQRIRSFFIIWKYYNVKNNRQLFSLKEFKYSLEKFDLLPNDLYRLSSWGIINGRPVLIDYGFTRRVRVLYKRRFPIFGALF